MTRPHIPMLTEREARMAGAASNKLCALRGCLAQGVQGGSLTVKTSNGSQSYALTQAEAMALIWLLRERDEAFLAGLNIELEQG